MHRTVLGSLVAVALAAGLPALPAHAADDVPRIPFTRATLPNGLEVILHPDKRSPLVAVDVWFHVGSGNETPGKTGFAHLFEHMMFQGAKHIGEDVHFDILRQAGASGINGTTNSDRTNYFEVVPSNQLETALWLESDRMGYLLDTLSQTSLDNQREVVRNERRQRYDNVPYGKERFAIAEGLYPEGHPYRYLTIGKHEDIAGASVDDVSSFFRTWYAPSNATLLIAGDFEPADAMKLVQKWFGTFPKLPKPATKVMVPPALKATVRKELTDDFARLPRVHYVWLSPAQLADDDVELDILADVIGAQGWGRLYKTLVVEKQLAQSVMAYQGGQGFSGEFNIAVTLKPGASRDEVERIVRAEVARAIQAPISDVELLRSQRGTEARFVWGLEDLLARGERLQMFNHYKGDPDYTAKYLETVRTRTPALVQKAAARWLDKPRVEVITLPKAAP